MRLMKELEMLSLLEGDKPVIRQGFYQEQSFRELHVAKSDFKVMLVDKTAYSNKGVKVSLDDPEGMLFLYISKDKHKAEKAALHESQQDHFNLGIDLGYPECCARFFSEHEPARSKLDNDYEVPVLDNSEGSSFPFYTNIFLRKQDCCLLSHFPCRLDCKESIEIGRRNLEVLKKHDPMLAKAVEEQLLGKVQVSGRAIEFVTKK